MELIKRRVTCFVWSVLPYGAETCTKRRRGRDKCCKCRFGANRRIRWMAEISNEDVLRKIKGGRKHLHIIKRRKEIWITHILKRHTDNGFWSEQWKESRRKIDKIESSR